MRPSGGVLTSGDRKECIGTQDEGGRLVADPSNFGTELGLDMRGRRKE